MDFIFVANHDNLDLSALFIDIQKPVVNCWDYIHF